MRRDCPQGDVRWNLVVSQIIFKLNGQGTKVVAYADDGCASYKSKVSFHHIETHGIGIGYSIIMGYQEIRISFF